MTEREALKLALDAFGEIAWSNETQWQRDRAKEAITVIKEALANVATNDTSQERVYKTSEIVHEPVAWRAWVSKFPQGTGSDWVYVTKPIMKDKIHNQPLYTTPPQRTWVGLTDDELQPIADEYRILFGSWVKDFAQAIEFKLKEKNT